MYEHVWDERWCSWVLAPPDRVPPAEELERGELTFVWGFLMDPRFLRGITGRAVPLAPAVLRGYRRETFVKDGARGFRLLPDRDGIVTGVVLIGVRHDEAAALDRFEQVPRVMVRKKVRVTVGDLEREAWVYLAAES